MYVANIKVISNVHMFDTTTPNAGFPAGSVGKNSHAKAGDAGSIPGLGRSLWRRKWQPTAVFLPGKSPGQRSLVGCNPWGCKKESDTTK